MFIRRLSAAYAGGAAGVAAALGILWLMERAGVLSHLGVGLRADLSPAGLYRLLIWGSLWGLLLLLPLWRGAAVSRGILFSLAPTATILLVYYPRIGRGYLGLDYGPLAPVVVLLLGALWGIVAALWHRSAGR